MALEKQLTIVFHHIFKIDFNVTTTSSNINFEEIRCCFPQCPILGPLLFLIYINDLYCAIKQCSDDFAHDTNLLNYNDSVKKKKKKQVN